MEEWVGAQWHRFINKAASRQHLAARRCAERRIRHDNAQIT